MMTYAQRLIFILMALTTVNVSVQAGTIYRFVDKAGVSTLSRTIPQYAAEQGYEILDDKSMRVIKRVMSEKERTKINNEKARIAKLEAEQQKRQAEQAKLAKEQAIRDRALLDQYPNEQVLIKTRDTNLHFIEKQIDRAKQHKEANVAKLMALQQQAAELELSGQQVEQPLQDQMASVEAEITASNQNIDRLGAEYQFNKKQYNTDLARVRQLLKAH